MDVEVERACTHRGARSTDQTPSAPVWRDTPVPLDVRVESLVAAAQREADVRR